MPPNKVLQRAGAAGAALRSRGRAPMLAEDGAAARLHERLPLNTRVVIRYTFTAGSVVLKAILRLLTKDLTGQTWQVDGHHPYFGKMVLLAFKNDDGSYWEAVVNCDGQRYDISIDAPDHQIPSEKQAQFAQRIIADQDVVFALAVPLLAPEFERWYKKPLPANWRDALKLVGFSVPANGDSDGSEWEVSYEGLWDSSGYMATCSFKNGRATSIAITR